MSQDPGVVPVACKPWLQVVQARSQDHGQGLSRSADQFDQPLELHQGLVVQVLLIGRYRR